MIVRGEKKKILFTDISEGSENGKCKEITKDAEDDLVDPNIKGQLSDDMIASVE